MHDRLSSAACGIEFFPKVAQGWIQTCSTCIHCTALHHTTPYTAFVCNLFSSLEESGREWHCPAVDLPSRYLDRNSYQEDESSSSHASPGRARQNGPAQLWEQDQNKRARLELCKATPSLGGDLGKENVSCQGGNDPVHRSLGIGGGGNRNPGRQEGFDGGETRRAVLNRPMRRRSA